MKTKPNITLISRAARSPATSSSITASAALACRRQMISTQGLLHIGEGGLIKGSAQGEHVRIDGRVDGNVHARGSLEINGQVTGDIYYCGTIRLGPRASLNGTLKRVARMLTIEIEPIDDQSPIAGVPLTPPPAPREVSNVTDISRAIG